MAEVSGSCVELCRACACPTYVGARLCIFEEEGVVRQVPEKLRLLPVQVAPGDQLPQVLCHECYNKLNVIHAFFEQVKITDLHFRQRLNPVLIKCEPDLSVYVDSHTGSPSVKCASKYQQSTTGDARNKTPCIQVVSDVPATLYRCSQCTIFFPSAEMAQTHVNQTHQKSTQPEETTKTAKRQSTRKASIKSCQETEVTSERTKRSRGRSSKWGDIFPFHQCDLCFTVHPTAEALARHQTSHPPIFECLDCSVKLLTEEQLDEHVKKGEHVPEGRQQPWRCIECGKESPWKTAIASHMVKHSKVRLFECQECGKKFTAKYSLLLHAKNHAKDWSHICSYCGKGFVAKSRLDCHIICHHTKEKPFKCDECDKRFINKHVLKSHVLAIHFRGEKPKPDKTFVCETCKKCFVAKYYLKMHMETHLKSLEERRKFECVICGERFIKKSSYKSHMTIHGVGERTERKTFECHICGKKMYNSSSMKKHLLLHAGVKGYVCEYCGKAFAAKGTLRDHQYIHQGIKPHQCHVCSSSFTQRAPLIRHLKNQHGIDGRIRRQFIRE